MTTMTIEFQKSTIEKLNSLAVATQSQPEEVVRSLVENYIADMPTESFMETGMQLIEEDIELYRLLA